MTQLVKAGSVKAVCVLKILESGHRNEVPARRVVGLTLAFAKICAGDCYEVLRVRVALVQIEGCHFASEALFWKAVALGNIEHGVLFEKRDIAHFIRAGRLFDLGNEIHLDPVFPLRTTPPTSRACLNVSQRWVAYPCAHKRMTLPPE